MLEKCSILSKKQTKIILSILLVFIMIYINLTCNFSYAITQTRTSNIDAIDEKLYPGYKTLLKDLQKVHPNWTFTLLYTDLDWNQVIKNETTARHTRSLIPASKTGEWLCYNCGNTRYDNGSWCCASEKAVAYYMDPRNFLTEEKIFQFETLSYVKESQTIEGVKKIIKGTFMEGETIKYISTDGKEEIIKKSYAQVIMEAAQATNVSPYHLASRIKQEQGSKPTQSTGTGNISGYIGYYNIFNIKASGNGKGTIITRALTYAKEMGWDTPEKSIKGGAKFLAEEYIKRGQDSLYLQKFDVDNSDGSLYYHQYMQNIIAPTNETTTIYKSYKEMNLVNSQFNFIIPMYKNMPSDISVLPKDDTMCTQNVQVIEGATNTNIREGKGTNTKSIAKVNPGDILLRIEIAARKENWYFWDKVVLADGTVGYIARDFIKQIDDVKICEEIIYATSTANIRNGPGTEGTTIITTLAVGQSMTMIEKDKYNKNGYKWSRVVLADGRQGYIATKLTSANSETKNELVKVIANGGLKLRSAAGIGENSSVLSIVAQNSIITRVQKGETKVDGYYWDKVINVDGIEGYVASQYLEIVSNTSNQSLNEFKIQDEKKQILAEVNVNLQSIKEKNKDKTITAVDKDGKKLSDTDNLGTGAKVTINKVEYVIVKMGDSNGDASIDAVDLLLLKRQLLKTTNLKEEFYQAADTNGDNVVDAIDLLLIKRHLLGTQKINL